MMNRMLLAALVCGLIALGTRTAEAQAVDTTAKGAKPDSALLSLAMIEAGRKIFHGKGNCSGCHGTKLQGGPIAPALTGQGWRHVSGTFDSIVDRIDNGLSGTLMVPHPGGITESQVFVVAAYVYSVSHGLTKP